MVDRLFVIEREMAQFRGVRTHRRYFTDYLSFGCRGSFRFGANRLTVYYPAARGDGSEIFRNNKRQKT